MELSLIMPVFNEGATLEVAIRRLEKANFPFEWELIIVDDGSSDGAVDEVERGWVPSATEVTVVRGKVNQGKGAAVRRGLQLASGSVVGIQDADLEYDPGDIPQLVMPILNGETNVVFGSREFGAHASYSFWYVVGNRLMSLAASALFNRYVTDAYTCYKFFERELVEQLQLTANGFEIEAELTGGLLRSGVRVYEVPISYVARSRDEGKKIRPADGMRGLLRLLRVRLLGW